MNTWILSGKVVSSKPGEYGTEIVILDESNPQYPSEVPCEVSNKAKAIEAAGHLTPGAFVVVSGFVRAGTAKLTGRRFSTLAVRAIEVVGPGATSTAVGDEPF